RSSLSPECAAQIEIAKKFGIDCGFSRDIRPSDLHAAVIIDAIFGTGLSRHITGSLASAVRTVNASGRPVISVDIPSGISADSGAILGEAVHADQTVTFGLPKRGHYLYPGAGHAGILSVDDIGFPRELLADDGIGAALIVEENMAALIPERLPDAHKNMFGHAFVVAGSAGKTGAALMTARACLRAGAGLVTLGVPETLMDVIMARVTEEMVLPLPDDGTGALAPFAADEILRYCAERFDVLAIGPGLGASAAVRSIVCTLLESAALPMVLDADALNVLAGQPGILRRAKAPVLLTPHPGELRRLDPNVPVDMSRIDAAVHFAAEYGVYLVAKGAPTISATPEGRAFVNTTGNPGMATAGAGDVLTGILTAMLGQGLSPLHASMLGVFLHGSAGDVAATRLGQHSLIATDIISALPEAFRVLHKASDY
ncbi:MAG TPA: NAD(P)H-hydrate dehydratase, partial [Dissulfurispiraceae bacterium]|nr:NAD(P)H-hydrate dehydratase [Dissulfurispiraceae bacterium]